MGWRGKWMNEELTTMIIMTQRTKWARSTYFCIPNLFIKKVEGGLLARCRENLRKLKKKHFSTHYCVEYRGRDSRDEYEICELCWVEEEDGLGVWLVLNEDRPICISTPHPHTLIPKAALKDILSKTLKKKKKRNKERKQEGGQITTIFYRCF